MISNFKNFFHQRKKQKQFTVVYLFIHSADFCGFQMKHVNCVTLCVTLSCYVPTTSGEVDKKKEKVRKPRP